MNITKYEWNLSCGGMDADSHGDYYRCSDIDPLLEELETLRASNTIKQANIELLEAENAKLIADQSVNLNSLAKSFGDEFIVDPEYYYISKAIEHLIKDRLAMQAEREAMMKQEPRRFMRKAGDTYWAEVGKETMDNWENADEETKIEFPYECLVFPSLPAQQIPEGYALEWPEPYAHIEIDVNKGISVVDKPSHKTVEVWTKHLIEKMLSASQPEGE